ncbi:hypothetical protein OIU79_023494 [Salix purpurea]|uniref:Uncharacterized protein n=1 Tax=Salix purpurea TaxID=77065 RepID=A0A9Q1A9E4_SALPP|nr:hypothetical protein OIU79_023494 [Salix purpurea]
MMLMMMMIGGISILSAVIPVGSATPYHFPKCQLPVLNSLPKIKIWPSHQLSLDRHRVELIIWFSGKGQLELCLFRYLEKLKKRRKDQARASLQKMKVLIFRKNKEGSGGVNMIDLIANLYKEKERNNGFGSGSDMNWANLNGNGLHVNGVNKDEMNSKGLDLDLKENGLNSDITESDLVKKDKNWNGNGVDLGLVNGNEPFALVGI